MAEEIRLVTHAAHLGANADSDALDLFLRAISLKHADTGEWADKYGTDYEDDTILIHHFCWCEKNDCLWCGGSGCRSNVEHEPHRAGCYQERLQEFAKEHGELLGVYDGREHWHVRYGSPRQKQYDAFKRQLCLEMGCDFNSGNEVHCTCGVMAEWREKYDACKCDWHQGRGIFRFGKAVPAPNFWHKPSNFQVRWYKYIGRDMEINQPPSREMFDLVSEDDVRKVMEKGQESAEAFANMIAEINAEFATRSPEPPKGE